MYSPSTNCHSLTSDIPADSGSNIGASHVASGVGLEREKRAPEGANLAFGMDTLHVAGVAVASPAHWKSHQGNGELEAHILVTS